MGRVYLLIDGREGGGTCPWRLGHRSELAQFSLEEGAYVGRGAFGVRVCCGGFRRLGGLDLTLMAFSAKARGEVLVESRLRRHLVHVDFKQQNGRDDSAQGSNGLCHAATHVSDYRKQKS